MAKPAAPDADAILLQRALDLARAGIGLASPNPCVGAVIVDASGNVLGTGSHTYDGVKHAETLALEAAGEKARGATLYVNLEPCSHHGRTGPCVQAILAAGIKRVVAAIEDPNPLVSGKGFAALRRGGVEVTSGALANEAKRLNESFAKYIRHRLPLVTLKAAMTLDGKIAAPPPLVPEPPDKSAPRTDWITGETARAHVQTLRHQNDAIMTGVGTIIADDPLLTDRSGLPRRRPLLRVVLDSMLRLPLESRIVRSAHQDVLVLCSFAEEKKRHKLRGLGVRVEQISTVTADGRPEMAAIARRLGEMEMTSVLVEGGSAINWAALNAGIVDKVFFYYAPWILAGTCSAPFAAGAGFPALAGAPKVKNWRLHTFGEDFALEGYLRDPYENSAT